MKKKMLEKSNKQIIITGASGAIGETVVDALETQYQLTLLDKKPHSKFQVECLDIADFGELLDALPFADVLIHLAAIPHEDTPENILRNNIQATFNVFEGARLKGIRRVIFVSSIMTYGDHNECNKLMQPLQPRLHTHPTTHYAVSKLYGEQLGQVYSANFGLSVICTRLGWFPRLPTSREHLEHNSSILLSVQDCKRLFQASVSATHVDYAVVNALSQGGKNLYDLDATWKTLGFYPNDDLEETVRQHEVRLGLNQEPLKAS